MPIFILIKIFNIIYIEKQKKKGDKMIATIRYLNCFRDKNIVFGTLSKFNVHIIYSQNYSIGLRYKIKLKIKDRNEINNILTILNKNTDCGVELLSCKPTIREIFFKNLFKDNKND